MKNPHIIVLGNEKGGSGKSTTAMHIITALLARGAAVGSLDLDARQRTLSRYTENRIKYMAANGLTLRLPEHRIVPLSDLSRREEAQREEEARFSDALEEVSAGADYIVIDCPGTDTHLSRLGHAIADTLVTPLNDSFVDLDLLARVDPETHKIEGPSLYAEMVWEARKKRAMAGGQAIDWIVMRNRVSSLHARNKARVGGVLEELAKRIGFRFTQGLSERVIYRELFLKGLTLIDLKEEGVNSKGGGLTMSHVAARSELRALIASLGLKSGEGQGLAPSP